jgi:hypothetical protein
MWPRACEIHQTIPPGQTRPIGHESRITRTAALLHGNSTLMGLTGKIVDNSDPDSLASRMRRRRTERFLQMVEAFPEPVRILDVGGTIQFWAAFQFPRKCEITLLNMDSQDCGGHPFIASAIGDARDLREFAESPGPISCRRPIATSRSNPIFSSRSGNSTP